MVNNKKNDLFFLAVLAILWVAFHYRILFLNHTFVLMDCSRFFFPLWKWGSQVIHQGLIPLWNPDAGFGTPFLADPEMAVWYPPKALSYLFLNDTNAFTFLILFHHLLVLAGFWIWARLRGFSMPAVFLGSIAFGFSFNCICLTWAPSMFFTFSWIPWVFLTADRYFERKRLGDFLFFSLVLGFQLTAGYPVYAYLTLFVLGLEWLLKVLLYMKKINWKESLDMVFQLAPAITLACCFALVWIIPFIEMTPYTNIARRLSMPESMSWGNLATWFNPFYLGHPLYSHPSVPHFVSVYFLGLPMVVLVLWGILHRKVHWISATLFFMALVLSLGENAWVGGWLKVFFPRISMGSAIGLLDSHGSIPGCAYWNGSRRKNGL